MGRAPGRALGRELEFASGGERVQGYVAHTGEWPRPGVVVIQEWWGLVDHIRDVCDRLAREGFVALAPISTAARRRAIPMPPVG